MAQPTFSFHPWLHPHYKGPCKHAHNQSPMIKSHLPPSCKQLALLGPYVSHNHSLEGGTIEDNHPGSGTGCNDICGQVLQGSVYLELGNYGFVWPIILALQPSCPMRLDVARRSKSRDILMHRTKERGNTYPGVKILIICYLNQSWDPTSFSLGDMKEYIVHLMKAIYNSYLLIFFGASFRTL